MKKTPLFLLAASLLGTFLTGCTDGGSTPQSSTTTPQSSETEPVDTSSEEKVNFDVQTSCESGEFDQTAYTFATVAEEDKPWPNFWDPEIRILVNQDNWSYVTGILESKTLVLSENESVLPVSAITVKPEVSSMSGLLESILLTVDRSALAIGTSHLKVHFENSNGAESADPIDLCVPVEVKEYGTLDVETAQASFALDLRNLDSKYDGLPTNFCVQDNDHVYGMPHRVVAEYPVTEKEATVEISLPLHHAMYFFVRVELENGRFESKRLNIESDSSFEMEGDDARFSSAPSGTLRATIAN